jgi:Type I phosphodiesterase / nucleotide pyrophosphatase
VSRVETRPRSLLTAALAAALLASPLVAGAAQGQAQRLVLIKVDGLPADTIERLLEQKDPQTGRNLLPWMHSIFIERGAWVRNFYVRGISLSAPSWSMLDTGQHLTIRGNAEFDRFIPRVYDYLNFFPFYRGYAELHRVDMPGVEVLDQFGIPLLLDQFPPDARYESMQLFQRGVRWTTLKSSVANRVMRPARQLINEWETGFELSAGIDEQEEKEVIAALSDPKILYLDLYLGDYDHTAHLTNDDVTQLTVIKRLDAKLGRIWTAIQASPLASGTVLALVSDHGMNSKAGTYSQGYNLIKFFNSSEGGTHHVVTVRYPLTEYKLVGLDPFVSYVVTPSSESSYLRNQTDYPTATIDPDGNERASVQLRNSDLNALHMLLLQLKRSDLDSMRRAAARAAVLRIIEANRPVWTKTLAQLNEELSALRRTIESQQALIRSDPKISKGDFDPAQVQAIRRHPVTLDTWQTDERGYQDYVRSLQRLLNLKEADLEPGRLRIESLLPKGVMGEPSSLYQLQNYVAGISHEGIVLKADGSFDSDRTFQRVNYFTALASARVRNQIQRDVGVAPIDFVAARVTADAFAASLEPEDRPDTDAVFVSGDEQHQALLLSQLREGTLWLRYLPVRGLVQDAAGRIRFTPAHWGPGFPLRLFEDPELRVDGAWLDQWHTERDWFEAVHRTRYSNGIIGLHEYFQRAQPASVPEPFRVADEHDWPVLRRFAARRRQLIESDLSIFASDHWNFNVRGFNPGGNHGSFLRISTHSVLMAAGGGVPAGIEVDRPYDSLSLVPTLLSLLGRLPDETYPGPVIEEIAGHDARKTSTGVP